MILPRYFWEKLWGVGLAASVLGVPFGMFGARLWDKWTPVEKTGSVALFALRKCELSSEPRYCYRFQARTDILIRDSYCARWSDRGRPS
jgi:hypothetical protein